MAFTEEPIPRPLVRPWLGHSASLGLSTSLLPHRRRHHLRRVFRGQPGGSRDQSASGLGRNWKWKAIGTVPLPPSLSHGARSPLVVHTPRPFHPALASSMRPSRPLA